MAGFVDLTTSLGLQIRHDNFRLRGQSSGYNPGLDGREQIVFSENRVWNGRLTFPPMFGKDLALMRSVHTRLGGRAGVLRVPLMNVASPRDLGDHIAFLRSIGVSQEVIDRGGFTYSDGASFSDGALFALPDASNETLAEDLRAGSTALKLNSYIGRHLVVGDRFSITGTSAKLHEVTSNDDGRLTFLPPVRQTVEAGALVRVSDPHIDVHLKSEDEWDVAAHLGAYSEPLTVNVVEAFDR